eukprot:CAMPEP_0117659076 /NCGR_PEP_ID=MMETSP0804-20121206/6232_1 /TAXON_ID=1074897 /ORGANISM="Tetraselmis astigmatica, Strain CCMP880" /LENGTH=446 /DNA_ID=CAMNT_0005465695 /DNA_START=119 /DNA_END=1458 /DNA_ORIENTATION=+
MSNHIFKPRVCTAVQMWAARADLALIAAVVLLLSAGVAVGDIPSKGLARTPPMGWLAWERFRCNTDCENDPNNCISEQLFEQMADRMVADGFLKAGYEYIGIDDCWMAKERDGEGRMVADPVRFPKGIKHLADYMHSRGLKLGLYADIGTRTCERYPGMASHMEIDAHTFAEWEIDYLKVDGCFASFDVYPYLYPELGRLLNQTGRPIVYSCSWPAYYHYMSPKRQATIPNYKVPYKSMKDAGCNLWRNWRDIETSWESIKAIIMYWWEAHVPWLQDIAGPGVWNDPDMLIIGNPGITAAHARAQMAMWSIFAAPLLMSNDLRDISADARHVLLNKEVIDINQDPAGRQGVPVSCHHDACTAFQVWKRELADDSLAVALLNLSDEATRMCAKWKDLRIPSHAKCFVRDLFSRKYMGRQEGSLCDTVEPQSAKLYKVALEHRFEVVD